MCVPVICLLLLNCAGATFMPVTRETGSALDSIVAFLRGSVQISFNVFSPKPRMVENLSMWQKLMGYLGYPPPVVEETHVEPTIICNVYVILVFIFTIFFYILFAKKYFSTQKNSGPNFMPFMSEGGDDFEISEFDPATDDEECKCDCRNWGN